MAYIWINIVRREPNKSRLYHVSEGTIFNLEFSCSTSDLLISHLWTWALHMNLFCLSYLTNIFLKKHR